MRHSPPGAAQSGRVSRSRAMPVGDRRSRPSESPHLLGVRAETGAIPTVGICAAAALRAAVPGPTGRTAQRSAFQAVPALVLDWRWEFRGLRPRCWPVLPVGARCRGPSCRQGYAPSREPSRGLGSSPPQPCGPLCRAPPGGLPRGRRSKPSPRFFQSSDSRLRPPSAGYAKRRPADLAAGLLGGVPAGS